MLNGASWSIEDFEIKDPEVIRLSDDVAVIAFNIHEELNVDGKRIELDVLDNRF